MSAADQARDLLAGGNVAAALSQLESAARSGDASAWLELGILYLSGKHVPRALDKARDYFRAAGEAGDLTGRNIYIQFLAIGVGADPDWPAAVAELRSLAGQDAVAASQIAMIDRMDLSPDGNPAAPIDKRQLSSSPDVWSFDRLFSADECAYLVARAEPLLQASVVVDPNSGELRPHPVRTSHGMAFPWVSEDLVIHALNRRLAAASESDVGAGEPLQILRYRPGQEYRPHFDAYESTDNQRVLTMLVYLNDDYEGGETLFTFNGLKFMGKIGDGLLFRNALPGGLRDETAQHAGLPVTRGEKWLASRWIRERPLVPA